jgi:hypothetical protein
VLRWGAWTKGEKKGEKKENLFVVLGSVSGVVSADVVTLSVVVVAGQACGGGRHRSSFGQGVVVAGTWQARDVMCDGYVTPEVGAGHAHTCDAALFNDGRHCRLPPPVVAHISRM